MQLDDSLPEAHASLAYIRAYYEWDWAAADREFRKALALRPNFVDAHFSYSRFLAASGRMEEAVAEIRRAAELDPRELALKANTALLSYFRGRNDDALKELLEISRTDPALSSGSRGRIRSVRRCSRTSGSIIAWLRYDPTPDIRTSFGGSDSPRHPDGRRPLGPDRAETESRPAGRVLGQTASDQDAGSTMSLSPFIRKRSSIPFVRDTSRS